MSYLTNVFRYENIENIQPLYLDYVTTSTTVSNLEMGVRGLTTFIAKNQETYFQNYKLCDCYVVLDAHSICAQIYKFYSKSNDCFGGDYDKYGRVIENFFEMLKQCNVTPIVVFDGGYEKRKLRTVYTRLKTKIRCVRKVNPVNGGETMFPLFVREVFKDVVLKLGVPVARCDFEADFEIACIARQLGCPVVSYDSDFYVFDVLYIPFPTMEFHVTKNKEATGVVTYFMKCKIYRIENFLKQYGGLEKCQLPLMAAVLGNDYISKGRFKNFYSQLKVSRKKTGERGDQQRQITAVVKWLQRETYESALCKILGKIKKRRRHFIACQIKKITKGYITTESEILDFLHLPVEKKESNSVIFNIVVEDIESDIENDKQSDSSNSEPDSDEHEPDSGGEEEEKIDLETITESEDVNLPQWFVNHYRRSEFPTMFMDLLSLTNCFYIPQVENVRNLQTIQISLPILKSIARILLVKDFTYFIYWARSAYGRIKKYNIDISDMSLPSLIELEFLPDEKRKNLLMTILGMNDNDIKLISEIDPAWQLYFYSLLYWAKNAVHPTVTLCHIYVVILCLININVVDPLIGHYRLKMPFLNKYTTILNNILDNAKTKQNHLDTVPMTTKTAVTRNDCVCFANSFISNFKIDDKTASNPKLFCIDTVDAFAQFQNCLYFIKHLNALLLYPFNDYNIADFYNGTFLYNLHANFETRNDVDAYIDLLLKNSPTILNLYRGIIDTLKFLLDLKTSESMHKKRRRKRRKGDKKKHEYSDVRNDSDEKSNESDIDVNNRFSVLRLVE